MVYWIYYYQITYLLANSTSIQQITTTAWDYGGKSIAEEEIKKELGNKKIREGVSTYNVNVGLSGIRETQVSPGASTNQVNVKIIIPGNNSEFKTTTPTIAGGWADPSFRVMFDLEVTLKLSALTNQIKIDDVSVKIDKAKVNGSNAVGTLVETLGDLFTNGQFSQGIVASINSDKSKKDYLASSIRSSLDRYVPASVFTANSNILKILETMDSGKIMRIDTSIPK